MKQLPGSPPLPIVAALALCLSSAGASAQDSVQQATPAQAREAQLERLRAELGNQIQLRAFDLLDELVFGWMESPHFASPTLVVLADVTVPVGFGSGLEALVENHVSRLLINNPGTNVQLAHCPSCQALVVHSDKVGTIISRGVDQPKALAKLRSGSSGQHAMFLDFEAEGTELVLRARITRMVDGLPIVFARTLSTKTSSAALLRSPERLTSAADARAEYLQLIEQRGPLTIPVRLSLSTFAAPDNGQAVAIPTPLPWIQVGAEMSISSARAWVGQLVVGGMFVPTVHTGVMLQARGARLLTGSETSLTHPDLYGFLGLALVALQGPTALVLADETPTVANLPLGLVGPVAAYPAFQTGLEVRINNRISAAFFVETTPTLNNAPAIGRWLDFGFLQIHSLGGEATFSF